jgi:hypothetical protein
MQRKITGFHHRPYLKRGFSSVFTAFKELACAKPIMLGKGTTGFTVNPCFFSVDVKKLLSYQPSDISQILQDVF